MKRIILAFCLLAHAFMMAQTLEFSALADNYNMSVRAIQIWQNKGSCCTTPFFRK